MLCSGVFVMLTVISMPPCQDIGWQFANSCSWSLKRGYIAHRSVPILQLLLSWLLKLVGARVERLLLAYSYVTCILMWLYSNILVQKWWCNKRLYWQAAFNLIHIECKQDGWILVQNLFSRNVDCFHSTWTEFCTCHNSSAVVHCIPLWPDLSNIHLEVQQHFDGLARDCCNSST